MTDETNTPVASDEECGIDFKGLIVTIGIAVLFVVAWLAGWDIARLLAAGALIAVVIWQACDPFAEVAQWVGVKLHVPGSVRGATLDAIASSMPELFSGIFFVVVALQVGKDGGPEAIKAAGAEGYGSAIATCAGSAVYNMILIPAVVALAVAYYRKQRPTVDVENEVLTRDGVWFLMCEIILVLFLFQDQMHWWMGLVFIGLYGVYIFQLYSDTRRYRRRIAALDACFDQMGLDAQPADVFHAVADQGLHITLPFVEEHQAKLQKGGGVDGDDGDDDDDQRDATPILFGLFNVPITGVTATLILIVATAVAATACYFLVEVTNMTADELKVPPFFVAVILAAAVSSVPDTFLSIGSAMRGDDSGAVSNAFGSNIFDICICLSIPLLVNSYMTGWAPVEMTQGGEPIPGLVGLRILLCVLTIVTLAILWHNRQLTRFKAFILIGLYLVFIAYAVFGAKEWLSV